MRLLRRGRGGVGGAATGKACADVQAPICEVPNECLQEKETYLEEFLQGWEGLRRMGFEPMRLAPCELESHSLTNSDIFANVLVQVGT